MVNPTMIVVSNSIALEQENSTETTAKAVTQVPNYAATDSESIKRYHASGMVFHIHRDTYFLS